MAKGFEINKRGIDAFTKAIQKEFDKRPIKLPVEADPDAVGLQPATTVYNYNGPVVTVTGEHAQVAWNNNAVNQTQNRAEQIAPGYEALARLVTDLLANLDTFNLSGAEAEDVRATAETVLGEVVKNEPDQGSSGVASR